MDKSAIIVKNFNTLLSVTQKNYTKTIKNREGLNSFINKRIIGINRTRQPAWQVTLTMQARREHCQDQPCSGPEIEFNRCQGLTLYVV